MPPLRVLGLLALSLILARSLPAQVYHGVTLTDPAEIPASFVRFYQRMLDGVRLKDTVALASVLSPTYAWTPDDRTGTTYERTDQYFRMLAGSPTPDSLYVRSCRIALYDRVVVGSCRVGQRVDIGTGSQHYELKSTVMMVYEAGNWRVAGTHVSVIGDPTP